MLILRQPVIETLVRLTLNRRRDRMLCRMGMGFAVVISENSIVIGIGAARFNADTFCAQNTAKRVVLADDARKLCKWIRFAGRRSAMLVAIAAASAATLRCALL